MSTFQVKASITASDDGTTAVLNHIRGVLRSLAADSKKVGAIKLKLEGNKDIRAATQAMSALISRYTRVAEAAGKAVGGVGRLNALLAQQAAIVQGMPRFRNQMALANNNSRTPLRSNRFGSEMGPIDSLKDAALLRARHATITAGTNVARSGISAITREDHDRFRATIENLPPAIQAAIDKGAFEAATKYRTVNQSDINEATRAGMSNLSDKNQTAANAEKLALIFAQAMTAEKIRTGDPAEAKRSVERFGKIADFAGKADDPEKLRKMMMTLTAANMAAGRDLSSEKLMTGMRGLKTLLPGLSESALIRFVAAADELGQRAGNEMFQFVDSMSGMRTNKKAMDVQKKMGLRNAKGKAVDEDLLNRDPTAWMEKHVAPQMKKRGVKFDNTEEDNNLIARLSREFGLRQTAENFIAREMQKLDERKRFEARANRAKEKLTPENMANASAGSLKLAAESVTASFGLLADKLTSDLQPAVKGTLDKFGNWLAEGAKDTSQGKFSQTGMFIAGAAVAGVTLAIKEAMNNPAQSAHTVAMGVHAAALMRGSLPGLGGVPLPGGGKAPIPPVVGAVGGRGALAMLGTAGAIAGVGYAAFSAADALNNLAANSPEYQKKRLEELAKIAKRKAEEEAFLIQHSRVYKPRNPLIAQDDSTGVDDQVKKTADEIRRANRRPASERTQNEIRRRDDNTRIAADLVRNATRAMFRDGKSNELNSPGEKARNKAWGSKPNESPSVFGRVMNEFGVALSALSEKILGITTTKKDPDSDDSPGEKNRRKAWSTKIDDSLPNLGDLTGSMEGFGIVVSSLPDKGNEFGANAEAKLKDGSTWGSSAAAALSSGLQGVIAQLKNLRVNVTGVPSADKPAGAESP